MLEELVRLSLLHCHRYCALLHHTQLALDLCDVLLLLLNHVRLGYQARALEILVSRIAMHILVVVMQLLFNGPPEGDLVVEVVLDLNLVLLLPVLLGRRLVDHQEIILLVLRESSFVEHLGVAHFFLLVD